MADTPQEESVVSQPTYKTEETTKAFATLLQNEETARNEELEATKSEKEGEVDLAKDNDDPLMEDVDVVVATIAFGMGIIASFPIEEDVIAPFLYVNKQLIYVFAYLIVMRYFLKYLPILNIKALLLSLLFGRVT